MPRRKKDVPASGASRRLPNHYLPAAATTLSNFIIFKFIHGFFFLHHHFTFLSRAQLHRSSPTAHREPYTRTMAFHIRKRKAADADLAPRKAIHLQVRGLAT